MKFVLAWLAVAVAACSGADGVEPENPVRTTLEQTISSADPEQPLTLRYNPGACPCPPLEVRVGAQWLRAEILGDAQVQLWLQWLAKTQPENLPVLVQVKGRVENEVFRTISGSYAVRVDVREIVSPLAPKPPLPAQ